MRKIVNLLKEAGANQVEVWVTCPPVKSACFYGIDMASHSELIASTKSIDQIGQTVGASTRSAIRQLTDCLMQLAFQNKKHAWLA